MPLTTYWFGPVRYAIRVPTVIVLEAEVRDWLEAVFLGHAIAALMITIGMA